jgi:hypothetical protein
VGDTAEYQVILSTTQGDSVERDVHADDAIHAALIVGSQYHLGTLRDGRGRTPRGTIRAVLARRITGE